MSRQINPHIEGTITSGANKKADKKSGKSSKKSGKKVGNDGSSKAPVVRVIDSSSDDDANNANIPTFSM